MSASISKGKEGTIVYEDDNGSVVFEPALKGKDAQVDRMDVADIEGNVDISTMEAWILVAVEATNTWLASLNQRR